VFYGNRARPKSRMYNPNKQTNKMGPHARASESTNPGSELPRRRPTTLEEHTNTIPFIYISIYLYPLYRRRLNTPIDKRNHQKSTRTEGKSSSSGAVAPNSIRGTPTVSICVSPKGTKLIHNPSTRELNAIAN